MIFLKNSGGKRVADTNQKKKENTKEKKKTQRTENKKEAPKKSKRHNYKKELENLKQEFDQLKDQYLRSLAEFENYKKRRDRDLSQFLENANVNFIEQILPVLDDFERSLEMEQNKNSDSFYKGVEIIYHKFLDTLKKQGVAPIEARGKKFDPELHEAVMQMESKDHDSNTIIDEAQKGYKYKDKVIRYSKVIVSK
ncbi:nucleotide exchange factor GrpE [candidate division KSB1 bacterium]|nr:nucleotide exchange factor GrpE [candidate division KSB1 bacterium]